MPASLYDTLSHHSATISSKPQSGGSYLGNINELRASRALSHAPALPLDYVAVSVAILAIWGDAMRNNATNVARIINYQTGAVTLVGECDD